MYKILVGSKERGGSTAQEAGAVRDACSDLEKQINALDVKSVSGIFVHDLNPLQVEVLAVVEVSAPSKKEK